MKHLYLLIDLSAISIPFIFSFHPAIKFNKFFRHLIPAIIITAVPFLAWDTLFTRIGVWGFNAEYVSGIYIFNLPFEEVMFFVCIPFSCLFTYYCFELFIKLKLSARVENVIFIIIISALTLTGFWFFNRHYTSICFLSTAGLLFIFKYLLKAEWIKKLFLVYPVLLLPFFIVNGILTGYGLAEPVVWYNNMENINLRIFTIPVEDFVYGFELIMINVFLFEFFRKRNSDKVLQQEAIINEPD